MSVNTIETETFKIAKGQIPSYGKSIAKQSLRIGLFVFAGIALLLLFLMGNSGAKPIVLLVTLGCLIPFFGLIALIIYFASMAGARRVAPAVYFTLTPYFIAIDHDRSKMSGIDKFGAARNEARSGESIDKEIKLKEIVSTVIKDNGIIIKKANYNMLFSPNGRIFIPREIENYESFKQIILNHKTEFNYV